MRRFQFFHVAVAVLLMSGSAYAQEQPAYEYAPVTVENLSKFFWTTSKMDLANDQEIDDYLRINECDIYKHYDANDFEWTKIRTAGRQVITQGKEKFPVRFEFMQPLRLTDYDVKTGMFGIVPAYQVNGVRKFEVYAQNAESDFCGTRGAIQNYERGMILELDRPLTLDTVAVSPETAQAFIASKMENYKKLTQQQQTKDALYESRDAYIVLKFHANSYTQTQKAERQNYQLAGILGTLEGYDIYGDKERTLLLHSENFLQKKELSEMEKQLMQEYQATKDQPVTATPAQ